MLHNGAPQPAPDTIHLDLPASYAYLHVLGSSIAAMLEHTPAPEAAGVAQGVGLAVHEICVNIVDHAYGGRPDARIAISLTLSEAPRRLVVELRDGGEPFDAGSAREPDLEEPHEHGYGLFLARALMDSVSYEREANGNYWCLIKGF